MQNVPIYMSDIYRSLEDGEASHQIHFPLKLTEGLVVHRVKVRVKVPTSLYMREGRGPSWHSITTCREAQQPKCRPDFFNRDTGATLDVPR